MTEQKRFSWVKPSLLGVAAGAIAISIAGFSFGWVTTTGNANKMAAAHTDTALVKLIAPDCVALARGDLAGTAEYALAKPYQQIGFISDHKWTEVLGMEDLSRDGKTLLATTCRDLLKDATPTQAATN